MKKESLHNEQLGYFTPEDYFEHSKKEMLASLQTQKLDRKTNALFKQFVVGVVMVPSVVFGVFMFFNQSYHNDLFEQLTIESLEVSEEEFDQWFDDNFVLNDE